MPLASYELFSGTEVLGRMAMQRMLAGLSTRRYRVGLEPVGQRTEQAATSTSRSAVSRRFIAATETAQAELLVADLSTLDLVGLVIDGVHFGEHTCVVALGIGIDGTKHPGTAPIEAVNHGQNGILTRCPPHNSSRRTFSSISAHCLAAAIRSSSATARSSLTSSPE